MYVFDVPSLHNIAHLHTAANQVMVECGKYICLATLTFLMNSFGLF